MKIRLDKYLADSGFGTRNEVKALVKSGAITINGEKCKDSSQKVDADIDKVSVNGEEVDYSEYEYYMLYKPAGVITASRDKREETVLSLIKSKKRRDLFPVGRLDRDTEGLLLITNDGELSHKLLSPGKHVEKGYVAIVSGSPPENIETLFGTGLDIGDEKPTKPAKLRRFSDLEEFMIEYNDSNFASKLGDLQKKIKLPSDEYEEKEKKIKPEEENLYIFEIKITEGRYHEIKRMFEAVGCNVVYLKRYSMGNLTLDGNLKPGEYKKISLKNTKK